MTYLWEIPANSSYRAEISDTTFEKWKPFIEEIAKNLHKKYASEMSYVDFLEMLKSTDNYTHLIKQFKIPEKNLNALIVVVSSVHGWSK